MANINEVAAEFYDALVRVRYPGVATIDKANLDATILHKNNRLGLLHWLLVQSLKAIDSHAIQPEADDTSLVQWYTNMGICDNKEALLGQCSIQNQLSTLSKLTTFIMNVLEVNGKTKSIPQEAENVLDYYLKTEVIPASLKLSTKLTTIQARRYVKNINERAKEHKELNVPKNIDQQEEIDSSTYVIIPKKTDENSRQSSEAIVKKFCETFEDIGQWAKPNSNAKKTVLFDSYVEEINTNLTQLSETLRNQNEIANTVIPTDMSLGENPLDQVIQDVVVRMEKLNEACDRQNDNDL